MKNVVNLSAAFIFLLISGCAKDKSVENGGNAGGSVGSNCRVNAIIAADSLSGRGLYALNTTFNSSGVATAVEAYDSLSGSRDFSATLTYKGDTVRIDANQFFLLDASKRVKKMQTLDDPTNPSSEKLIFDYTYDANGYLAGKNLSIASIPLPLVKFTYSWNGGNLVKVEGNVSILGNTQKVFSSNLEYDLTRNPKNFIHVFPDGFETFPYIGAVDLGKKPANLLKTINVSTYDSAGVVQNNFKTNIKNVKFSTDGYITEWYAEGDGFDALGIFSGRTLFKYFCK